MHHKQINNRHREIYPLLTHEGWGEIRVQKGVVFAYKDKKKLSWYLDELAIAPLNKCLADQFTITNVSAFI